MSEIKETLDPHRLKKVLTLAGATSFDLVGESQNENSEAVKNDIKTNIPHV